MRRRRRRGRRPSPADGDTDIDLLAPGNGLAVGGAGTILAVIEVDTGGNSGPYDRSSLGSGTRPGGETVTDVSQDGEGDRPRRQR